jgi:hypothetical protein
MRYQRRTNALLGLMVLLVALVLLANALGWLPAQIYDLVLRAWPALLVLGGLTLLLRGRVPVATLIALVLTVTLVTGVAAYAFSTRSGETRSDYQETIAQPIEPGLGLLRIRVNALSTDIELLRSVLPNFIAGEFSGSSESQFSITYEDQGDGSATMTLRETPRGSLPMLEAVGRGTLRLEVPPEVPLEIEVLAANGAVALNMGETQVERMNLDLTRGNAIITLPDYQPVTAVQGQPQGTLAVRDGAVTLVIPPTVAARLDLDRGGSGLEPEYDPSLYNFLFNRVLESRTIEQAETVVQYAIVAPRGRIRLEVANPGVTPAAEATEAAG